jgi:CDP-glucose 4,6-dehydratase
MEVLEMSNSRRGLVDPAFWVGRKVFLTGHTGFKGGWLSLWLASMGAKVTGYALAPNTMPSFFNITDIQRDMEASHLSDIRNFGELQKIMMQSKPEIVIHMAAQPLVRYSYANPIETYATNVMGTVNVLEAIRSIDSVSAAVVVTTDKCYENSGRILGYSENEPMGGYDPYSSSKGCAELVTSAYRQSYFSPEKFDKHGVAIATARAGNVIGGGDWSEDRLIPDAIKAFEVKKTLLIRNPLAVRPWQHVLEPLSGYLVLAQALHNNGPQFDGAWNFGPSDEDTTVVRDVIELLVAKWGPDASWTQDSAEQPHEAHTLRLNCQKARESLGWIPRWNIEKAIQNTADWYRIYFKNENMKLLSLQQINQYQSL